MNDKRIHRLWRDEGLRVPYKKRKKRLRGLGVVTGQMCPIRPNVIWAADFQFDQTRDGRTIKVLNVIDEFTRECLIIGIDRSIDADSVVRQLDKVAGERGFPLSPGLTKVLFLPSFCVKRLEPSRFCRKSFSGDQSVIIEHTRGETHLTLRLLV